MRTRTNPKCSRRRLVATGAVLATVGLVAVAIAQTFPGTASPGNPFEVFGFLYSGSAPTGSILGDGWAQGAAMRGVLDDNGLPNIDAYGNSFRAARSVDGNWGNQGDVIDATLFLGGNKNSDLIGPGQAPWEWGTGSGGPQKNDITNAYFHTRVDPLTGDRWVFVAAETRATNGDSHVDFEFNQAGVIATGATGGLIVGLGPAGGRTVNDFLINIDFVQGGQHPTASVRVWDGAQFVLDGVPGTVYSAANLVDIPHGAGGTWKHFDDDGAEVNVLSALQFVEGAANLTAMGIHVDPCATDATFSAKTRSSSSWESDLKDFVLVRFPLEPVPQIVIKSPDATCTRGEFQASAVETTGLRNATLTWSASGCGHISSDPTAPTITVQADPACACDITLTATVVGGECAYNVSENMVIAVGDDAAPTLSSKPSNRIVECDAIPQPAIVTADDDCWPVDVELTEDVRPGLCVGDSLIDRTWTAVDECDNATVHTQEISVEDTTAPTMSGVPADAEVACDAIPAPPTVTASDNCSEASVQLAESSAPGSCQGDATITRTWTATDACGNDVSRAQRLFVSDDAAPTLAGVPSDVTVQCDALPNAPTVTASDNCSAATVDLDEAVNPGRCAGESSVVRTWTGTDACGNAQPGRQVISLVDTTAPVLHGVPEDATVECDGVPAAAVVTATDNCSDTNVTFAEQTVPGPAAGLAVITRTWTATDACGNSTSDFQVLTVVDTTAPTLQGVPPDLTVECDAVPGPPVVTARDNCANPSVSFNERIESGPCDGSRTIIRTWTAVDGAGNRISQEQRITVIDTTAPIFNDVPADATVECDDVPAPADVTAHDNCSDVTVSLAETSEPGECEGTSTIRRVWTARDECGNEASQTQVLDVVDQTAPTLDANPQDITVECDAVPQPRTIRATDACDPTMAVSLEQQTTPGRCQGEYDILRTWEAVDDCGNGASVDQWVAVQDTKAPRIALTPNRTQFICDGRLVEYQVAADDNCSDAALTTNNIRSITATNRDRVLVTTLPDGTIRITATGPAMILGSVTAADECGNISAPFALNLTARLGREACSQGFWRNHTERWGPSGFTPDMRFVDAFGITDLSSPEIPSGFDTDMTLFEAANQTGGSFNQTLLQGVAALLNAAHPSVDYPLSVGTVKATMQAAFAGDITMDEARAYFNFGQAVESECGCPVQ